MCIWTVGENRSPRWKRTQTLEEHAHGTPHKRDPQHLSRPEFHSACAFVSDYFPGNLQNIIDNNAFIT